MQRPLLCAASLLALLATSAAADKKKIVPPAWVQRPGAPPARFSPGILVDGTLYISGQMGSDPNTGEFPDNFEDEMKQALNNVGAVLKAAGMTYDGVVAVTVYLSDMDLFQRMNTVYLTYFKEPLPTRSTVGVAKLASPKGRVEITVTAHKP
jgi:2-iminobutanoate/2-iminopropanoate deaminase